ncbi:MAG: sigma 54-interacting transcriptional regulator [Ignavibacteriaceae bacterium]|nr:sigma 54-interacting transcriptional regulator [Ignavibacteriaceae bacterium]
METINEDLALLLSINDDIATIKDTESLFLTIFEKLYGFYGIKILGVALLDKNKENLGFIIGKIDLPKRILDSTLWFQTVPINSIPVESHLANSKLIHLDAKYLTAMQNQNDKQSFGNFLEGININTFILIPMNTGGELIGYLILSSEEYSTNHKDDDYSLKIANLIGSAISNVKAYEELQSKDKEKEMQINLLVDLVTIKDRDALLVKLANEINRLIPCEYVALYAQKSETNYSSSFTLIKDNTDSFKIIPSSRNLTLALLSLKSKVKGKEGENNIEIAGELFDKLCDQFSHIKQMKDKYSINSFLVLQIAYENLGELNLILGRSNPFLWMHKKEMIDLAFSQNVNTFFAIKEVELGMHLLPQLGLVLSNFYAFEEIQILTNKLEQEKNFLLDEINLTNNFLEIIGESSAIQNSLSKVRQVAPLDATVLILGETGTGKELIAKAVHNLSKRKENTFITVNCAALPSQLIESELFGHEKGSFTGAIEKRIGKFEIANGGTIFLDEIGELPLEIQSKLLRVIQEKEFERVGGKNIIYSDVRIVAATNRNLDKEVAEGKFRADLFFRLNVFPISVPPLRERSEDIPLLVKYFTDKYSKKIGKEVKSIGKSDLDMLMQYNWPGNIRELEHITERAIIVSEGTNLNFQKLLGGNLKETIPDPHSFKTLKQIEKEHILDALKIAKGKITGENSASTFLGINGKTLGSKMRKLGIKRQIVIS